MITAQYGKIADYFTVSTHYVINVLYHFEIQSLSLKNLWGECINGG